MATRKTAKAAQAEPAAPWRATLAPTIDAYLDLLPSGPRAALSSLRRTIRAAAPKATETISYRIPTFRHEGALVAFSASPRHCALHVMSPALVRSLADELQGYDVGTSTIRFTPEEPLPTVLVKKLVKARIAENESRRKAR